MSWTIPGPLVLHWWHVFDHRGEPPCAWVPCAVASCGVAAAPEPSPHQPGAPSERAPHPTWRRTHEHDARQPRGIPPHPPRPAPDAGLCPVAECVATQHFPTPSPLNKSSSMTATTTAGTPGVNRFTRNQLLRTAQLFATDPDLDRLVDLEATERNWQPPRRHRPPRDLADQLAGRGPAPAGTTTSSPRARSSSSRASWPSSPGRGVPPTTGYLWEGEGRDLRPAPRPQRRQPRRPPGAVRARRYSPSLRGMTRYAAARRATPSRPASSGPESSGDRHRRTPTVPTGRPASSVTRRRARPRPRPGVAGTPRPTQGSTTSCTTRGAGSAG